jgi:hypothetical protein
VLEHEGQFGLGLGLDQLPQVDAVGRLADHARGQLPKSG